jgi:urease accessory protein
MSQLATQGISESGAARLGIGGPVGSGKTALIEQLIPIFQSKGIEVGVITNDLLTKEDAERLQRSGLIAPERVAAVEAGACPHTVIREDPTLNMEATDRLISQFPELDLVIIESGGDNLASTFSLDLVDEWLFVIDVAGGDDIPRKRGPGVMQCDLLVINKVDLAPYVGVDLEQMLKEAKAHRKGKPVISINCRTGENVDMIVDYIIKSLLFRGEES